MKENENGQKAFLWRRNDCYDELKVVPVNPYVLCEAPLWWCDSLCDLCDKQRHLHWELVDKDGLVTSEKVLRKKTEKYIRRKRFNLFSIGYIFFMVGLSGFFFLYLYKSEFRLDSLFSFLVTIGLICISLSSLSSRYLYQPKPFSPPMESCPSSNEAAVEQPPFSFHLADLGLSTRTYNCLAANGIYTLGDLVKCDYSELKRLRNLGKKCMNEIEDLMRSYGLFFGMTVQQPALHVESETVNKE